MIYHGLYALKWSRMKEKKNCGSETFVNGFPTQLASTGKTDLKRAG